MSVKILSQTEIAPKVFECVLEAPLVARKAQAGQFAIAMAEPSGERIPLTLADWDEEKGTVTLVIMAIGNSTRKLTSLQAGEFLYAFAAPLGRPSHLEPSDKVFVCVAGGVGTAPVFPIARAAKALGRKVYVIQGARSSELLFWRDKMQSVADKVIFTTDDGSFGKKGLVTEALLELIKAEEHNIGEVLAIGPTIMMKSCADVTRPFGIKTIASLNTLMIDGTGMCGGCRVTVNNETRFTCVDGPEFDAHAIDWQTLLCRQKTYHKEERCHLEQAMEKTL